MKKICCSNESLCDYFFNTVLYSAFSGPLYEILFLYHNTFNFTFSVDMKVVEKEPQNHHQTMALILSCHERSVRAAWVLIRGSSVFQEKS